MIRYADARYHSCACCVHFASLDARWESGRVVKAVGMW